MNAEIKSWIYVVDWHIGIVALYPAADNLQRTTAHRGVQDKNETRNGIVKFIRFLPWASCDGRPSQVESPAPSVTTIRITLPHLHLSHCTRS